VQKSAIPLIFFFAAAAAIACVCVFVFIYLFMGYLMHISRLYLLTRNIPCCKENT
jgi:hypothetical protein